MERVLAFKPPFPRGLSWLAGDRSPGFRGLSAAPSPGIGVLPSGRRRSARDFLDPVTVAGPRRLLTGLPLTTDRIYAGESIRPWGPRAPGPPWHPPTGYRSTLHYRSIRVSLFCDVLVCGPTGLPAGPWDRNALERGGVDGQRSTAGTRAAALHGGGRARGPQKRQEDSRGVGSPARRGRAADE